MMCDFSEYGGRSDEWLEVEKGLPPLKPPGYGQGAIEARDTRNKMRQELAVKEMQPFSGKLDIRDHKITARDGSALEARSYRPIAVAENKQATVPVYLHLHGGGFLYGTIASEDACCARLALNLGITVLNLNYRHTPEFTYPTAWDDVEDAFIWIQDNIDELQGDTHQIVVGGVSAGAQLTASLVLKTHLTARRVVHPYPPIAGQVLMIPCLLHKDCYDRYLSQMKNPSVSSYVENKDAPILPQAVIDNFLGLLKIEDPDPKDLRLNPGNASSEEVKGLPPTTFGIAGADPLRDEGLLFAKMLTEAKVPTRTHIFRGLPHGFRGIGEDRLSASKRWDEVMEGGIKWALSQPKPSEKFVIEEE